MPFLTDASFLIILVVAIILATIPSFIKPMRLVYLLLIVALWLAAIVWLALSVNAVAALIGAGISLLWGALFFLAIILLTGVKLMAKKRYG